MGMKPKTKRVAEPLALGASFFMLVTSISYGNFLAILGWFVACLYCLSSILRIIKEE